MPLPERYILPIHPKDYPNQGIRHCGAYTTRAVLSAYGFNEIQDPSILHTNPLLRLLGFTSSIDYYPAILRSYGLDAQAKTAERLSSDEKLDLLKGLLAAGNPVILSVGNFFSRGSGEWLPIKGTFMSHWISLWGYDDAKKVFYVFDSQVPQELCEDVPIGNKTRPYSVIPRIWRGAITSSWVLGNCTYIEIKRRQGDLAHAPDRKP
jgi:hypothetical protein